jgi:hypothetical protein
VRRSGEGGIVTLVVAHWRGTVLIQLAAPPYTTISIRALRLVPRMGLRPCPEAAPTHFHPPLHSREISQFPADWCRVTTVTMQLSRERVVARAMSSLMTGA